MLVGHPIVLLFDQYQTKVHLTAKIWATLTVFLSLGLSLRDWRICKSLVPLLYMFSITRDF
uniref:Uncharacterized protein n=1 Tax=Nelumbo nucifera TaxID=4432 RepID=A0A822YU75_NELNU|nr:TPA_asm: hypothetical protein HUJ06_006727 [Nelumbo nucifera]